MKKRIQPILYPSFFFLIFAFLFLWFSRIHPLIPFDADDWTYLYSPGCTDLGCVESLQSISGSGSSLLFESRIVPGYAFDRGLYHSANSDARFRRQRFHHSLSGMLRLPSASLLPHFPPHRVAAHSTFLIFHFLAMRREESENQYLLYCVNLTCYYYYLLPSLINASLVMCLMNNRAMDSFLKMGNPAQRGCFYVLVYFAIFSNLPASGILAAYAGCVLMLDIVRRLKAHTWNRLFAENAFYLGVLLAWLVSAVFEFNGGRSANLRGNSSLFVGLFSSCKCLARAFLNLNRIFLLAVVSILLISGLVLILSRGKDDSARRLKPVAAAAAVALAAYAVYLLVLCAAVNPYCLERSEYLFGVFFFGVLLIMLALTFLICRFPKILMVLPILTLSLASAVNTQGKTFLESYFSDLSPAVCADISRDLICQVQEAARQGKMEIDLLVPMYVADPVNGDNWPQTLPIMDKLPDTLYAHGLIDRPIYVNTVADPSMNTRYHIPIPED